MATIETRTGQPVAAKREVSDLDYSEPSPEGAGWVVFSAIVLGLVGVWAFFEGLLAIFDSKVYAASATFVFSDLRTWGWMMVLRRPGGPCLVGPRDGQRDRQVVRDHGRSL